MRHITEVGKWQFEVKEVRAIRTDNYGDPFTATLTLKIVNGDVYIENLLTTTAITSQDFKEVENFILALGFDSYYFCRYTDLSRTVTKRG